VKLTNEYLWLAKDSLAKLLEERLPVKIAYALAKLGRHLEGPMKDTEAVRVKLLRQYGNEANGQISVTAGTPEHEAFLKDWTELLAQEIDVDTNGCPIALPDTLSLPAAMLLNLDKFVTIG